MDRYGSTLAGSVDHVFCLGVLHHVNDSIADQILASGRALLAPTGRFSAFEPTKLRSQDPLSRFFVSRDRGDNVRIDTEWHKLFLRHYPCVETSVLTGLLRIPYTHIAITARNSSHRA